MRILRPAILLIALLLIYGTNCLPQETNLWNQQYGTRSTLLGGAVIGSVTDMSATYYNPGALALFKEGSILLSARGYEFNSLVVENGAGEGRDLTSSSLTAIPDLVASSLPFNILGSNSMAFSILVRNRGETDIQARGPIPPTTTGGTAGGELILQNDLSEIWGGLTWSALLDETIGVGVTTYLAVRDQDFRSQILVQELKTNGDIAASIIIDHQTYQQARFLWKAGIGLNLDPLTIGATITTPGIGVFGSGSSLVNSTRTGFDIDDDGIDDNLLAGNYQQDVDADFRSSWAYGFGAGYKIGNLKANFSGEYIEGVDFFKILDTQDFVAQSTGDTISVHLTHETQSVFNYAIALEYAFGEHTKGYASFASDFSAGIAGGRSTLTAVNYDLFHIGGGAAFTVGRWDLIVGGVYAFGNDKVRQAFNITDPGGLTESLANADVRFSRIRVLFGFSFALD